ncbi:MAG: peptidoglycan editing factor PgeF [Anaerolineae bacterium]
MIWHQGPPPFLTFASLGPGQRHAVFTRLGGVSEGHLASLNQSPMVSDELAHVHENQRRAQAVLHCGPEQVVNCQQVHGCHVAVVGMADGGSVVLATDGLVTADPGVVLTMRYADCVPVLLHCAARRVVGMAHAGWRGTVQRVAAQTALTMMQAFGCQPGEIVAGIGPSIGPCCYEVGPQVVEAFAAAFPGEAVVGAANRQGHAHVDLWQANAAQLRAVGVQAVEVSRYCTRCRRDVFYSHRGDGGRTGRFAAYIGLLPVAGE